MDYKRFLELSEEFGEFVVTLHTLYLDSVVGFNILHQRLIEHQNQIKSSLGECEEASSEFQDKCGIDYKQLCGEEFNVESVWPFMKQGEVKKRTARNEPKSNYILMGHLCVVQAFAYWETYLRKKIRIALGVPDLKKHVSCDFWGDMRNIRNAILHHNGIATSKMSKKMKLLTWFKPGEFIDLDFDKMKFIFSQMADFRNVLDKMSLPPSDSRLPSKN